MEYITVKELFKITKGKKVEEIDYKNENSIRYIQIDDLRNNNNIKHCENINKYVIAKKEDIIIAWDGANAGTIGFGIEGAIGSTLAILRKENKEMDTEFCGLFLRSKSAYLREKCTGATIPHIQRRALEDIKIPKISLNKQIEIKNIINKAQELIDKRKEQIQDLDELVKSQFIEMFGDFSKEIKYELKKIGDLVNEGLIEKPLDGNHGEIHPKSSDFVNEGVPFIMANALKDGKVNYNECNFITEEQANKLRKGFAKCGDVLLTHKGTIGKTAIVGSEYETIILTPQVTYYRILRNINNVYLRHYFMTNYFQTIIGNIAGIGSTRAYIGITAQLKLPIIVPPIELQNQFTDFVKQVDKLKFEMEKSLKELEDNFNALMQKAFNGELFN